MHQFKAGKPIEIIQADEGDVLNFSLKEILPTSKGFSLHLLHGNFSELGHDKSGVPQMLRQVEFTKGEIHVFLPLLKSYPYFCPYEELLASFRYEGSLEDSKITRCRNDLQKAMQNGTWDLEMRAARNCISRVRHKIECFGLDINSVIEAGYGLQAISPLKKGAQMWITK